MDRTLRRREINLRVIADATHCARRTMVNSVRLLLSQELRLGTITREDYDKIESYVLTAADALNAAKRYATVHADKLEIDQRRLAEAEEASASQTADDNEFNSMQS